VLLAAVPAGQRVHAVAPASDIDPLAQGSHVQVLGEKYDGQTRVLYPSGEKVPASHKTPHSYAPAVEVFPAGQLAHCTPLIGTY